MDPLGNGGDQDLRKNRGGSPPCFLHQLNEGELGSPVDGNELGLPRFCGRSVDLFGRARPSAGLGVMVAPFVVGGRTVAEARVQAQRVMEGPDGSAAGQASLGEVNERRLSTSHSPLEKELSAMASS